ncbi:salicylate 1-monooxygenase [Pseudomonas syringae group genomosp. 3]|uniref:salicylate 1-monooxygenase n=1 Tax=Pseudomonas syringae group genomosp. 3 TaxID=251701 RepID=UPI000EFFE58F|nr:salicylate 1-monooxygenase [Pseudomonas syringae group genomosp. 3]
MTKSRLQIGIIGGGITGVALAIALSKAEHLDVHLFEAAPAFGEIGAGVSFGSNAVRAINALGLGAPYHQTANSTPAPWQDVWFEWRNGLDESYIATSLAPGVGQSSIHRADFLDAMTSLLPPGVAHFGKRATGVNESAGQTTVDFADGTSFTGDLIIAADGIKSALRCHVLKGQGFDDAGPRFTGTCAYRGLIDSAQLRAAFRAEEIDEHLLNVPQMYLGVDRHILTFPVKGGKIINVVAFISEHSTVDPIWPKDLPWVKTVEKSVMLEAFNDWGAATRILLDHIDNPSYWALHDIAVLPTYSLRRVLLVGDAAHATLPHQGAGAGQGLEDAWFLAELLTHDQLQPSDLDKINDLYEKLRRPRASRVQQTSREMGKLYEFRHSYHGDDVSGIADVLANGFDWLWNHDLKADIDLAKRELSWDL